MLLTPQLESLIGPFKPRRVPTDDGVELQVQVFGDGPAVVFANGIGVRYPGALRQMSVLRDRGYQVICWDYRGLGHSSIPDADTDVTMARHAWDLVAILDQLRIERAVLVGWSMGVQVSLEAWRYAAPRVAGMVALLGTYGRPFRNAFPPPLAQVLELGFACLKDHPRLVQAALDLAVVLPDLAFGVLSRALFIGRDADRQVFDANVRSVASADKRTYLRTMLALAAHDARDVLPDVSCPALIICGERDHLTPPRVARAMADQMQRARYEEIAKGTHFSLIEQPERINELLLDFVDEVYAEPKRERVRRKPLARVPS
jgi:pimeloyl-ACP methyl ester carboxylesterase